MLMRYSTILRGLEIAALAAGFLLVAGESAAAQLGGPKGGLKGKGGGGGFLEKKNRNRNGTPAGGDSLPPEASPADRLGTIRLGQSLRGTLPAPGSRAYVNFRAPAATTVRFTIVARGDVGLSKAALISPTGLPLAALEAKGRRFTLPDFELPEGGLYTVRFVHDGEGELELALTSGGRFAPHHEEQVKLTSRAATRVDVEGFEDRAIEALVLESTDPVATDGPFSFRATVFDDFDEKIASFDGTSLKGGTLRVAPGERIAIDEPERYQLDMWLTGGESPRGFRLRVVFKNPPLATGTVKLREPGK
jgi:hypothetical protein